MALRGRKINNFVVSWCLVALGGLDSWVSFTSFQPQQLPTKSISDIENWILDYSEKKGKVLDILVKGMIQSLESRNETICIKGFKT